MVEEKLKVQSSNFEIGKAKTIKLPLTKEDVLSLNVGDPVLITGRIVSGRDRLHKFFFNERPSEKEIPFDLKGTILYHCGPIIRRIEKGFKLISGGPTTSIRVEMYEHRIISDYGIRGVMGKGGMGAKTLEALKENGCLYFHTISGAGVYLADRVKKVVDVWKLEEFGMTEAMWVFDVEEFPAIVTMDARGRSIHEDIERLSFSRFKNLIGLK
ncbi:MAG: FumA C-terminus/TtdB family hydratase beta subunit [Nitrospirota bacterium]